MRFRHDPDGTRLPVKLDATTNGEFAPIALEPVHRHVRALAFEQADANARRLGQSRRSFLVSACGVATTLLAHNAAYAALGRRGGFYDVPHDAGLDLHVARSTLDWGFDIRVVNPAEVGADRLLNTLAAHQRFGGPLIIVDFGTATTFDVVDKDGGYLGGVICPGINLSLEALHQAAAQLPRIGIARPQAVIGRQTVPAMQSGVYWGYVAMVEGLVARIKAEYGGPMKVVATGGLAPLVAEGTMVIEQIEPDLTLDGLRMLAERNPAPTLRPDRTRLIEQD